MLNRYLLPIVNANLIAAQKKKKKKKSQSIFYYQHTIDGETMVEVVCKVPTKELTENRESYTIGKQDETSLKGIDGSSAISGI